MKTIPNVYLCTSTDISGNEIQCLVPFGTDPLDLFSEMEDWDSRAPIQQGIRIHAKTIRDLLKTDAKPEPFTVVERLLALDAACCACEFPEIPLGVETALSLLQDELDGYFFDKGAAPDFVERQIAAVQQLADHPESFS